MIELGVLLMESGQDAEAEQRGLVSRLHPLHRRAAGRRLSTAYETP
jgi:hypothetical protein